MHTSEALQGCRGPERVTQQELPARRWGRANDAATDGARHLSDELVQQQRVGLSSEGWSTRIFVYVRVYLVCLSKSSLILTSIYLSFPISTSPLPSLLNPHPLSLYSRPHLLFLLRFSLPLSLIFLVLFIPSSPCFPIPYHVTPPLPPPSPSPYIKQRKNPRAGS